MKIILIQSPQQLVQFADQVRRLQSGKNYQQSDKRRTLVNFAPRAEPLSRSTLDHRKAYLKHDTTPPKYLQSEHNPQRDSQLPSTRVFPSTTSTNNRILLTQQSQRNTQKQLQSDIVPVTRMSNEQFNKIAEQLYFSTSDSRKQGAASSQESRKMLFFVKNHMSANQFSKVRINPMNSEKARAFATTQYTDTTVSHKKIPDSIQKDKQTQYTDEFIRDSAFVRELFNDDEARLQSSPDIRRFQNDSQLPEKVLFTQKRVRPQQNKEFTLKLPQQSQKFNSKQTLQSSRKRDQSIDSDMILATSVTLDFREKPQHSKGKRILEKLIKQTQQSRVRTSLEFRSKSIESKKQLESSPIRITKNDFKKQLGKLVENSQKSHIAIMLVIFVLQKLNYCSIAIKSSKGNQSSRKQKQQDDNTKQSSRNKSALDNSGIGKSSLIQSRAIIAEQVPKIENGTKSQLKVTLLSSVDPISRRTPTVHQKVPKNYYYNYRVNLLRETVEREREEERKRLEIQGLQTSHEECTCHQQAEPESPLLMTQRSMKDTLFIKQKIACDRLHHPLYVCRRCCSTNHNPYYYHMKVFPFKPKRRRNRSATRIILAETQLIEKEDSPRPASQDSGMRRKQEALLSTDWADSRIYQDMLAKVETNRGDLDRIFNQRFPENDQDIFTDMEVNYKASILKMKLHEKDIMPLKEVKQIFNKGMRTLKFKMQELLLWRAFRTVYDKYMLQATIGSEEGNTKALHSNTIKLLLRCKKMCEAKVFVQKILKNVKKREEVKEKLLESIEQKEKEQVQQLHEQLTILSSRIVKDIGTLGYEHRNMKRQFCFNREDYLEKIMEEQTYFKDVCSDMFDMVLTSSIDKNGQLITCID